MYILNLIDIWPSLQTILTTLNTDYQYIISLLPELYFFEEGVYSDKTSDGGDDLFDGGNFILINSLQLQDSFIYSDN
jgi:hypothetical protein